jgi:hypothetical protein
MAIGMLLAGATAMNCVPIPGSLGGDLLTRHPKPSWIRDPSPTPADDTPDEVYRALRARIASKPKDIEGNSRDIDETLPKLRGTKHYEICARLGAKYEMRARKMKRLSTSGPDDSANDSALNYKGAKEHVASLGVEVCVSRDRPYPCVTAGIPLPGSRPAKRSLVLAKGRGSLDWDVGAGSSISAGEFAEDLRVLWREYLTEARTGNGTVYIEAGATWGEYCTVSSVPEDSVAGEATDVMRLVAGIGARYTATSFGYCEISVSAISGAVSGDDTEIAVSIGLGLTLTRTPRTGRRGGQDVPDG